MDYTKHPAEDRDTRRKLYINRHIKREINDWKHDKANLLKPSYLSRYILW